VKIVINNLHGSVQVELLQSGQVTHRELFDGKTSTPYARSIPADIVFDSHRAVTSGNRTDNFTYEVTT
jgi:hypothetical protein